MPSATPKSTRVLFLFLSMLGPSSHAQQTVLNVPSADVLDRGQSYTEWDAVVGDSAPSATVTPRSVNGIGHGMETGVNVSSFGAPDSGPLTVVPIVKWKFLESPHHTLAVFTGGHLYLPIRQRTYTIGGSAYLAGALTLPSGTRIAAGVYDFSAQVIDRANRGGVQASIEQTLNPRLTLATDWFSGNNNVGFVTSGLSYKITHSLTLYPAYEMGNHDLLRGNHSLLFELGWNSKWRHTEK